MDTTKVFVSGKSQAVRIPKDFRFECDEVYIEKKGKQLLLTPKPKNWDDYFANSNPFKGDLPDDIKDFSMQEREDF